MWEGGWEGCSAAWRWRRWVCINQSTGVWVNEEGLWEQDKVSRVDGARREGAAPPGTGGGGYARQPRM